MPAEQNPQLRQAAADVMIQYQAELEGYLAGKPPHVPWSIWKDLANKYPDYTEKINRLGEVSLNGRNARQEEKFPNTEIYRAIYFSEEQGIIAGIISSYLLADILLYRINRFAVPAVEANAMLIELGLERGLLGDRPLHLSPEDIIQKALDGSLGLKGVLYR